LTSIGYWVEQDDAAVAEHVVYILAHPKHAKREKKSERRMGQFQGI